MCHGPNHNGRVTLRRPIKKKKSSQSSNLTQVAGNCGGNGTFPRSCNAIKPQDILSSGRMHQPIENEGERIQARIWLTFQAKRGVHLGRPEFQVPDWSNANQLLYFNAVRKTYGPSLSTPSETRIEMKAVWTLTPESNDLLRSRNL